LSLRVLLANVTLAGRTGTEIVTRDLASGLLARGHQVSVFAPTLGALAEEITNSGVRVISSLSDLHESPDIVHGHHFLETVEALARFPQSRGVFVCHDRTAAHSVPPRTQRVHRYVAVDENCAERLRDDWQVPPSQIRMILNAVDTRRFLPRSPLPPRPARALVFSNYATPGTHDNVVRAACARQGISVDVIGAGTGAPSMAPEAELGKYDLVFAKARCALESMAVGSAVVLCDVGGSGPMVTSAELPRLRPWNFGQRTLRDPLGPETLVREINRYNPADAAAVSRTVREHASLDSALDQYESVYSEVMSEPVRADDGSRPLTEPLLLRTGRLERELAAYRSPERMRPLSDDDVSRVHLTTENPPRAMVAGASVFVRVRIQNDVDGSALGTWPPFPVHLACRWRTVDSPQFLQLEGPRTLLHHPVGSRDTGIHFARVIAPAPAGRYVLRITLVQEGWRWLDDAPVPAFTETDVIVTKPTLLTQIGRT
jgi:Glycosyltransferase Family 4